jgi:hypothetical protein
MSALDGGADAHGSADGSARGAERAPLDTLLLARIACAGGATRAQLTRDLGPIFSNRMSPAEWRQALDLALTRLVMAGLARDNRGKLRTTEEGAEAVARFLGEKEAHARSWNDQRDIWLIAKALEVNAAKGDVRKALTRPDGLGALIVQQAFGLSMRQALSPSKLRAALALVALERAFGDNVKAGLQKRSALSAKAGRVLAGQLLASPREIASDGKLISALAADKAGAARAEIEMLRIGLLRRLAQPAPAASKKPVASAQPAAAPAARTGSDKAAAAEPRRPGLAQFSAGVLIAARRHAEGWSGNRKALISQVWTTIRSSHPEWGLSEIEFKDMLAGAHRAGQLVLSTADLKNKDNMKELEESAILYKNTVWHFVRVED